MKNRLAHLHLIKVDGDESPFEASLPQAVRTNMFAPCELYVLKDHLILMLEMGLEAIENNRGRVDNTPEASADTRELIAQRQELLAWARSQSDELVYMALYPASEDNDEDDVRAN